VIRSYRDIPLPSIIKRALFSQIKSVVFVAFVGKEMRIFLSIKQSK